MSIRPAVAGIIGCLILPLAAAAQQPTRPAARLVSTAREDAKPAFELALVELMNIGYARTDAQLEGLLRAMPENGLIRALWAGSTRNITPGDRARELDRAVTDAAKASTPELVLATAIRELNAGRTAAGMTLLDASAHLLPEEPVVAFLQTAYAGSSEDLLRAAEAAHVKFPNEPGLLNLLAYARYRNGFQKEGLEAARQYAELLPQHPNSHDSYAELLQWQGDLPGAEREYRRALEIDPTWFDAHLGLAGIAMTRGDMRTARTEVEAALASARGPVEKVFVTRDAGLAAALTKDLASARRYLNEAIGLAEANGMPASARDTRMSLAVVEAAAGNAREARSALDACRSAPVPSPYIGGIAVEVGALLNDRALMEEGVADMEETAAGAGNTGTMQQALHLSRSIRASATGDITNARAELANVKEPTLVPVGQGFIMRALQRDRDRAGAARERAAMDESFRFEPNTAVSLLVSRS